VLHAKQHERMNRIDLEGVGRVCGKNECTKNCEDDGEWFHDLYIFRWTWVWNAAACLDSLGEQIVRSFA